MLDWIKNLFPNLFLAARRWQADDASSIAASVAYYLALSLFPMILLLISGFGLFLQYSNLGRNAEADFLKTLTQYGSPDFQKHFSTVLGQLKDHSLVSTPFGLVAGVFAAIGVFAQFDRGFEKIWRIESESDHSVWRWTFRILKDRGAAFLMLLFLGTCVVVLFCLDIVFHQVTAFANEQLPMMSGASGYLKLVFAILANAFLFGLVYRILPKVDVTWSDAFRGGMVASIVWQLGKWVFSSFLIGMRYTSAYGAIGSFIAILLWCYYGISIVFFGAEYVQVLQLKRAGKTDVEVTNEKESQPALAETAGNPEPATTETPQSRVRPRRASNEVEHGE